MPRTFTILITILIATGCDTTEGTTTSGTDTYTYDGTDSVVEDGTLTATWVEVHSGYCYAYGVAVEDPSGIAPDNLPSVQEELGSINVGDYSDSGWFSTSNQGLLLRCDESVVPAYNERASATFREESCTVTVCDPATDDQDGCPNGDLIAVSIPPAFANGMTCGTNTL